MKPTTTRAPLPPPYAATRKRRLLDPDARPRGQAYAFAVAATLLMLVARLVAHFEIGDPPIVIAFVIPIVLSAIIGGLGPGLCATAVAAIVVPYFLFAPEHSFAIAKLANAFSWFVLIAVGVIASALIEALHQSRRRLEAAERLAEVTLASIGDAIVATGIDGRVAFVNAEAQRLTGWSSDEARGEPLTDVLRIVAAASREPLADPVPELLRSGAPRAPASDVLLLARDGRTLAIEHSGAAIRAPDGTLRGAVIVFRDCSARRLAEDETRRAYEALALAQRASHSGVWDFDFETGNAYCSPEYCDLYGVPQGTSTDRERWLQRVHPDDRARMREASRCLLASGTQWSSEFRIVHPVRGERWIAGRGTLARDANAKPLRFTGVDMDVTDRRRAQQGLLESEMRFRQLIESLPQLIWTCTADGSCDYVNPRYVDYTGVGAQAHRGSGWLDCVHPDERAAVLAAWTSARGEERDYRGELRMRRHDGAYRWFDARLAPLHDETGSGLKWIAIASDIDHERELRETLRREKERFAQLAAAAPGVVHTFAIDANRTPAFRYASPGITEIYGVEPEALARDATAAFDRIHRDDIVHVGASMAESARTMSAWRAEFRVLHPEKGEIWIEGHSAPVREADGTVVWHGILHDITERKRMEEALRMSRSQLIAALDAGGMGAWTWDVVNDRFSWDESVARVLGLDADDAARTSLAAVVGLVHPADRERFRASIDDLLREGTHASGEYRIVQADGGIRWIEYTARVEHDADGRALRLIGINVDITERKRAEEAQLRSQKLEALGTLAGGIAHDFNNILVAITGNTRLAKSDLPRGHPAQESLDEIARAGARAVDLVRRILTFSRPYDHKREVMALAPVVDEALKLVRATLPARVEIRTRYGAQIPPVAIDPTQIHQIIVNLATNASHAIGLRGGHIDVHIDSATVGPDFASHTPGLREGRYVRLEVADDGCGMSSQTVERIFDPFFTTKPQGLGTGLGLSVVHGIVKSHDGAVSVYSEPGRGTAFRLYFPAIEMPAGDDAAAVGAPARRGGAHVLLVDDDAPLILLVSRMLERIGYRVTGRTDAAKALAELRAHPQRFDALVTDLVMGGLSGFDLAREALALRPDFPVVMTSGVLRPEDQQAAAALGVRALILKPDTIEELSYVLNRLLRENTGSDPALTRV